MFMKIALTIVAHNEEKNIEKCLLSALNQTLKPEEIVVVCHNCTDETEEIVRKFREVKVVILNGPAGVVYARAKAYASVSSDIDIIAATDGDSFLSKKWLENLTKPFADEGVVATGGAVYFTNSIWANLMSLAFFPNLFLRRNYVFYFWGANHAFRKSVYEISGGLGELIEVSKKINLYRYTDDCFLSLLLGKYGTVQFASNSFVYSKAPKINEIEWLRRSQWQKSDRIKLFKYFGLE